jgi:cholest-4-en-3-one 26-monooxygenase
LGVPVSDWPIVHELVWRISAPGDPRFTVDGDPVKTAAEAHLQIMEYSEALAKKRMADPQDDFLSVVVNSEIDGTRLSLHEITTWFFFLIAGALETTRNTISMGLWLFMQHPDQLQLMLSDPSLRKGAIEEVLRWVSPSRNRLRIVTEDAEWGGREMHTGDWVVLYLPSANWDERQFENPEKFDILRYPNPHLSLGEGIHYCLGRNLARLEMAELLPRTFELLQNLQLTSAPTRIPDALGNGWSTMPVSFTPVTSAVA